MKILELVPIMIIVSAFIYGCIKRVKPYEAFTDGIKNALNLVISLFPYITAVMMMNEIFEVSGLNNAIIDLSGHLFKFAGIPKELIRLIIIKPFSGGGSLALLAEIYETYGADSYLGRAGSVIFGSSETVFFIAAVYFSNCKTKRLLAAILISLFSTLISAVFACFICHIL